MTKRNTRPAVAHMQKVKAEPRTNLPSLSKARLKELIEEAAWMLTAKKNNQAVFSP
jgi:hypothetical protein